MYSRSKQFGAAATEFALVVTLFFALIIAVIELSRVMYIYSTAIEATRLGARVAAVCSVGDVDKVKARMIWMLPVLTQDTISITYPTTTCSAATCEPVTVKIHDVVINTIIPLVPLTFNLPAFSTSVPSESLDSTNNPICSAP